MKENRIAWKIGEASGHGDWVQTSDGLHSVVKYLNDEHGAGTHWVETRPQQEASPGDYGTKADSCPCSGGCGTQYPLMLVKPDEIMS